MPTPWPCVIKARKDNFVLTKGPPRIIAGSDVPRVLDTNIEEAINAGKLVSISETVYRKHAPNIDYFVEVYAQKSTFKQSGQEHVGVSLYQLELVGIKKCRIWVHESCVLPFYSIDFIQQSLKDVENLFGGNQNLVNAMGKEDDCYGDSILWTNFKAVWKSFHHAQNIVRVFPKREDVSTPVPKFPDSASALRNIKNKSWRGLQWGAEIIHIGDVVVVSKVGLTTLAGARIEFGELKLDSNFCTVVPTTLDTLLSSDCAVMEVSQILQNDGDKEVRLQGFLCHVERVLGEYRAVRSWVIPRDGVPEVPSLPSSPTLGPRNLYDAPGSVEYKIDPENNTAALGLALDPADVLTDRARGWVDFVRALKHHFDRLADAEKAQAKSHTANQKEWSHPSTLRELAFDGESSIHSISAVFKADATAMASKHAAVQKSLDKQTVSALDNIKKTIKKKVDVLEKEQKERNKERLKDKEMIVKAKENLTKAISFARRPGTDFKRYGDPWLANLEVKQKLALAKTKHAARNQKLTDIKADFKVFEANIIRELKVALIGVSSISEIMPHRANHASDIENALTAFDTEREWEAFCVSRLNKSGGPAMFETEEYEGYNDPLVGIVHEGLLSRKSKGLIKTYKEHYYVVTAGGYLHEFKAKPHIERGEAAEPEDSIYLGDCTLDPLGTQDRKPEEFILTEKKEDGKMFQRASHTYKYIGSNLAISQQFHAAISSVAKSTMGVVSTGSTNALGRSNTLVAGPVASDAAPQKPEKALPKSVAEAA
ncbi:UNVERIFIED_CONTAM: hypothetical protein HDU68_009235 [Siphonaria sp. JEL0065]|nr:hypothetical protein HDU68_009235 [Siphonaria sp. JEL0065]